MRQFPALVDSQKKYFTSLGQTEGYDAYPHADILNDSYRKWNNDFRAPNEEKIQIPKIFSPYGFK